MYIAFEGGEGSGKSCVIKYVASTLITKGYKVLTIREPGGTEVGSAIRDILLNKINLKISGATETLLFFAARAQLILDVVKPSLERDEIVLTDRCYLSSYAYQGYGRGMDLHDLDILTNISIGKNRPDLVILLNVEPKLGLSRKHNQNETNRLELEAIEFHERVRQGYLNMAKQDSKKWSVIDSSQPIEEVQNQILSIIMKSLNKSKRQ
ncbi:dTMP kinase [Patescibacteria group bacterium]|nr:dTMP kinase [Patescibacteria group bacterium]